MCHDLKPFKIDDDDPLFIFKTTISQTFFIYHMSLCKLLIFMVTYGWHTIGWRNISWLLTLSTLATNILCNLSNVNRKILIENVLCNYNIVTNGSFVFYSFLLVLIIDFMRHNLAIIVMQNLFFIGLYIIDTYVIHLFVLFEHQCHVHYLYTNVHMFIPMV
jgi:hypothetical protein